MSRFYGGWAPYVPVAERRAKAAKEMDKLRKKGVPVSPVTLAGKKIATTFWGKAWCDNLESYRDYDNRLPRGRTYVRNGSVVDLQIAPREVTAVVAGSELYKVTVSIGEVAKTHWRAICAECSGGIDSLVELLQGRFSKGVMERLCRQGAGLFPKPAEMKFSCSCPDWADMCKHVAAVMYGVGARLDGQPELLFRLRAVNEADLVADIGEALPVSKRGPAADKVLESDDMAALFGLDMAEEPAQVPAAATIEPPKKTVAVMPAARKVAAPKRTAPKQAAAKPAAAKPAAAKPAMEKPVSAKPAPPKPEAAKRAAAKPAAPGPARGQSKIRPLEPARTRPDAEGTAKVRKKTAATGRKTAAARTRPSAAVRPDGGETPAPKPAASTGTRSPKVEVKPARTAKARGFTPAPASTPARPAVRNGRILTSKSAG